MGFKKYSELISHIFVAEQYNNVLMKNHKSWPTGSIPFPEVNEINFYQRRKGHGLGRGHVCGQRRNYNHGGHLAPNNNLQHQQCKKKDEKQEAVQRKNSENKCHKCKGKGHRSRTCRASKRLVELYQAFLKNMDNNVEENFISEYNVEPINLDVADYFEFSEGKIDHRISDGYGIIR